MSPTAGLRSPPSKQGARASVEMEPSDVPVYDWPGAGAVWVALTKRGWLAHTRAVGAGTVGRGGTLEVVAGGSLGDPPRGRPRPLTVPQAAR